MPGAGTQEGRLNEPLALRAIASNAFWQETSSFAEGFDQAATMLQPVGGMDRIAWAFARRLGQRIRYDKVVTQIRRAGEAAVGGLAVPCANTARMPLSMRPSTARSASSMPVMLWHQSTRVVTPASIDRDGP